MLCSGLGVVSVASDAVECISIVLQREKPRFQRLPLTVYSGTIETISCRKGQELQFWLASVIVIAGSARPWCQQRVQMSMRLPNSRTMCLGSGFEEVPVRSDNEPAVLALKESAATALKLSGVTVKTEESALYDSQRNGLAKSTGKDVKRWCRNEFGLSRPAFWRGVHRRTSFHAFPCEVLCCDGEQMPERSRKQGSPRAAQGAQVRASTTSL